MGYAVPLATGEPFFGAAGFFGEVALEMIREQIAHATGVGVHFDHPVHSLSFPIPFLLEKYVLGSEIVVLEGVGRRIGATPNDGLPARRRIGLGAKSLPRKRDIKLKRRVCSD